MWMAHLSSVGRRARRTRRPNGEYWCDTRHKSMKLFLRSEVSSALRRLRMADQTSTAEMSRWAGLDGYSNHRPTAGTAPQRCGSDTQDLVTSWEPLPIRPVRLNCRSVSKCTNRRPYRCKSDALTRTQPAKPISNDARHQVRKHRTIEIEPSTKRRSLVAVASGESIMRTIKERSRESSFQKHVMRARSHWVEPA